MNWGTIYQCDAKTATLHKVPQAEWQTACGIDLYEKIPITWGLPRHKFGWNIEAGDRTKKRCKKCFPNQRKAKKP